MVANRKVTGTASSMPTGIALGTLVALAMTIAGAMVSAWLVGNEHIREAHIGYCAMVILLLSSWVGARAAFRKIKHRKLLVCAITGLGYYGALLAITALFFGGQYQALGVTALLVIAGSVTAALTGRGGERKRIKSRVRSVHR